MRAIQIVRASFFERPPISIIFARLSWVLIAVMLATLVALSTTAAMADPPTVSRVSAPLVTPDAAWSYYGSATIHTVGVAAWTQPPPEITALAHSLGAGQVSSTQYIQNVFVYVRNNIETEFRFGLSKGARGALIDQSGTPFDQAELMVKLLRLGGVSASYQIGTISLTAQQFGHWTGFVRDLQQPSGPVDPYSTPETFNVDAAAACHYLADAGIPATVDGAGSCSGLTGNLGGGSPIVMAHVWVVVGGVVYDPSFKLHVLVPRMDIPAMMGCGHWASSSCSNWVSNYLSGTSIGSFAGAPLLSGFPTTSIDTTSANEIIALQHSIEALDRGMPIVDVIGGTILYPVPASVTGIDSSAYTASGAPWTGDVPDQYRTTLMISVLGRGTCMFYGDEIAGRRLVYMGRQASATDFFIDNMEAQCGGGASPPTGHIQMTITHPYAANSGTYGSDSVDFSMPEQNAEAQQFESGPYPFPGPNQEASITGSFPVTIIHGFGDGSQSTQQYASGINDAAPIVGGSCQPNTSASVITQTCHVGNAPLMAENIRVNDTLLLHIVSGVTGAAIIRHHDIGIIYSSRSGQNSYMTLASMVSIDGTRSEDTTAPDRALEIASRLLPGLEMTSTAEPWSGPTPASGGPSLGGQLVLVTPSQMAAVLAAFPAAAAGSFEADRRTRLQAAADAGYTTLMNVPTGTSSDDLYTGELFLKLGDRAYTIWAALKGASIGDPSLAVMNSAQVSDAASARKHYANVSPSDGELTFTAAPDIVTGSGKFPESLPFIRTYQGGDSEYAVTQGSTSQVGQSAESSESENWHYSGPDQLVPTRIGGGWTDNYNISVTASGDVGRALGVQSASEASSAISWIVMMDELAQPSTIQDWAKLLLFDARLFWLPTFIVRKGAATEGFVELPDGTMNPPPGSKARLTADLSTESFTYTGAQGDRIIFDKWAGGISGPVGVCAPPGAGQGITGQPVLAWGAMGGWEPSSWTFPNGVVVSFDYQSLPFWTNVPASGTLPCWISNGNVLSGVHNNLGHSLTFTLQPYVTNVPVPTQSNVLSNSYNNNPLGYKITAITDENGRSVTIASSCPQLLCSSYTVTDPAGHATRYEYAPDANSPDPSMLDRDEYHLRRWFTPDNPTAPYQTFAYDDIFRIQSVTDILSHPTKYFPGGVFGTDFSKSAFVIDPLGNTSTGNFDRFNNELESIDALDRVTTKTYDDQNRLVRTTLPEGNSTEQTYDARSNVLTRVMTPKPGSSLAPVTTASTYMEGPSIFYCANPIICNDPATQTNGNGVVTSYAWDPVSGLPTKVLSGLNGGLSCIVTGGVCPETDASYTTQGGLHLLAAITKKLSAAQSLTTDFTYDAANHYVLASATVDPSGLDLTTGFTFDAMGNLTEVDGPRTDVADVSDFTFDADRRIVFSIGPGTSDNGTAHPRIATKYTYDADDQVIQTDRGTTTSATGSDFASLLTVITAYDPAGNKLSETTPTSLTQFSYDADDRLLCTAVRMNPAAYASLPASACTMGAQGSFGPDRISEIIYDAAGQTRQLVHGLGTAVQQVYETFKYSPNGKEIAVADADAVSTIGVANADALNANTVAAHQTNFIYDGFDRLVETLYGDGSGDQIASYDNDNNPLTRVTRAGQTITNTYDALDRLASKTIPAVSGVSAANTVSYAYDLAGRITSLSDTLGNSIGDSYDALGRRTGETQTMAGLPAKAVSYQYDQAGNRSRVTWPDGYYVTYGYDAANRLTAANENGATALASYAYDNLGRRALVQYGAAGAKVSYSWSAEGDLLTLSHDLAGAANDVGFTNSYTPAHQIVASSLSNPAFQYSSAIDGTASYAANGLNQYANVTPVGGSAVNIGYDLNGNLTSDGTFAYGYDPQNRLMTVTKTGTSIAYAYDPLGRRTAKTVNGTATYFLHAGSDEIAEYDGAGDLLRRYVPGPGIDQPIAMVTASGTKTFFHQDKMGSVIAMSDASGNLIEGPYTYDAYGDCITGGIACASGEPFKYTGQRFDPETGLYYYRARYYSPLLGRFLQTDPIGYADDINWYAYAENDPANKMDPSGETCTTQQDGSQSCRIDQARRQLTDKQKARVAQYNKSYTATVNKLAADPKGSTTIRMPVYGSDGKPTGKFRSATVNSGELAKVLERRIFVAAPNAHGGDAMAQTSGNTTTVFSSGLAGARGYGMPANMPPNLMRQVEIAHEGMHGSGTYTDDYLAPAGTISMGVEPWRTGHQEPYNRGVMDLLNIPY